MNSKKIATILDLQEQFSTEKACAERLYKLRWTDGFKCSKCGDVSFYNLPKRRLMQCKGCGCQVSLTAGTVMHGTHLKLRVWVWAFYLMTSSKHGISALEMQRQLGIGSYKTAWLLCHKIRNIMSKGSEKLLKGFIEVDDAYIGGPEKGFRGRKMAKKSAIVIAVESKGDHAGQANMTVIEDVSSKSLNAFVTRQVCIGSSIKTDDWKGYGSLEREGYSHVHAAGDTTYEELPWVHLIISNLKALLIGTFHGVSKKHLQSYLNEYVFRFNLRFCHNLAFGAALSIGVVSKSLTYKMLCV